MTIDISFNQNKLLVNSHEAEFRYPIERVVELDSLLIVLLEVPFNEYECGNIWGVDFEGNLLWQVQDPAGIPNIFDPLPFKSIEISRSGEVVAADFSGRRMKIDIAGGKILGRDFTK